VRQFARRGYDRASLRSIASDAGVDQRLVAHYFGSKRSLFVAAVGLPFNPADLLPKIVAGSRRGLRNRIQELLVSVLETSELHERLAGVVRAAATDQDVARMMRGFLEREVIEPADQLLDDDARIRIAMVGSQIVGLVMVRSVIGLEPIASMSPRDVAAVVAPTLERYLVGPLRPSEHREGPLARELEH
jgi:AcrR family transcriptional regulator